MFFLPLQCLKRLAEYVNEQNQSVFVPRGLMIVNPMERGLRVVSFHEFYSVSIACITIEFLFIWSPTGSCAHTVYRYFKKGCWKKCARDNPKQQYDIWSIHCFWYCSCWTYFCCFPLALANIRPFPLVPFFQISLKNSELKTTHNTFQDCRMHFFWQPFSKYLYSKKNVV